MLGAVLLRNDAFDVEGVSDLQPDDFHLPKSGAIWAAIRTLLHGGHPVDIVTLEQQLQVDETINLVGGLEALGNLADRYAVTQNVGEHASIVKAKARARRAQRILAEAQDKAANIDADDVDDFIAETQGMLASIEAGNAGGWLSPGEVAERALKQARERAEGKVQPFGFHIQALNQQLDGGPMPNDLVVIAARPGMGKTCLGYGAFEASGMRGEVPLMFALEMSEEQMGRREITSMSASFPSQEIGMRDVKCPTTQRGWNAMIHAVEELKRMPGRVFFDRAHIDKLIGRARSWRRQVSKPGPIIIDYLQLLDPFGADRKLTRNDFIGKVTRELKLLAKELQVPVLLLCQLNRDLEKREDKRPKLSDLRESGSIEQDIDTALMLYRPAMYEKGADPMAAEVIIPKCREGVPGTVNVRFEGHFSRFLDVPGEGDDRREPGMEWQG